MELAPAIWSALAASCSAIAALMMLLVHRRNLLSAHRPEIILLEWDRRTEGEPEARIDYITFKSIKNIGKGAAYRIVMNASLEVESHPIMGSSFVQLLPSGETQPSINRMAIFWSNIKPSRSGSKHAIISIEISCFDMLDWRHDTTVRLFIPDDSRVMVANAFTVAPGINELARETRSAPLWRLKIRRRLSSLFNRFRKAKAE